MRKLPAYQSRQDPRGAKSNMTAATNTTKQSALSSNVARQNSGLTRQNSTFNSSTLPSAPQSFGRKPTANSPGDKLASFQGPSSSRAENVEGEVISLYMMRVWSRWLTPDFFTVLTTLCTLWSRPGLHDTMTTITQISSPILSLYEHI